MKGRRSFIIIPVNAAHVHLSRSGKMKGIIPTCSARPIVMGLCRK